MNSFLVRKLYAKQTNCIRIYQRQVAVTHERRKSIVKHIAFLHVGKT